MQPRTAEQGEKDGIIDGRIQLRHEALSNGRLIEGENLRKLYQLPAANLSALADELDTAPLVPTSHHDRANSIVVRHIYEYERACSEAERADFDSRVPEAKVEMTPR